jgi:predicted nuclease of restriction endonuclease-like (RecB) superfamily
MQIDISNQEYIKWFSDIKSKIQQRQIKAAIKVNTELLDLYWDLGQTIVEKQSHAKWGDGIISRLSKDLMREFPEMKGFSKRNLETIRKWYLFYNQEDIIAQQLVAQLKNNEPDKDVKLSKGQLLKSIKHAITQIPWGHNIVIITKCKLFLEAIFYVQKTMQHSWSRSVLVHQIESKLYLREGQTVNNFKQTLPKPQSDLATQTLKDPYIFDFLSLTNDHTEKDLEDALIEHITKFLLELGAGFAFVGRQFLIQVGKKDFYLDLLFYHIKLHCYVVVELKVKEFQPEYAGKLNFYLTAVDRQLRTELDQPTIGILICKTKDKVVAEYALSDINKPIGVSEYKLSESIPENFKGNLPTINDIEKEIELYDNC